MGRVCRSDIQPESRVATVCYDRWVAQACTQLTVREAAVWSATATARCRRQTQGNPPCPSVHDAVKHTHGQYTYRRSNTEVDGDAQDNGRLTGQSQDDYPALREAWRLIR